MFPMREREQQPAKRPRWFRRQERAPEGNMNLKIRKAVSGHLQHLASEFLSTYSDMVLHASTSSDRKKRKRQLEIANNHRVMAHRMFSCAFDVINGNVPIYPAPMALSPDQENPRDNDPLCSCRLHQLPDEESCSVRDIHQQSIDRIRPGDPGQY